ncbi:hypothetical protein BU16DRAFT_622612 [Lophium mytilinum]|uniref:tRNA/rRNA methyltransferase SpoU type domain-containing protein n=1 Tax=Lophium mytilinum TaxID=390894 RepID=A0A6A6QEM3_9PEZI|nr:hypothetical protein BU16DRAFT_622612 [Lophium mytilinum]
MASLPGLATLFLDRIPSEAREDTVRSFIESVRPRNRDLLDLSNVKLGLELLRACPSAEGLGKLRALVVEELDASDEASGKLREIASLCSEYENLGRQVVQHIEDDLLMTAHLLRVSDLGYHVPTEDFFDRHVTSSIPVVDETSSADDMSHQVSTTIRYVTFLKVLLWHANEKHISISGSMFTGLLVLLGAGPEIATASGDVIAAFLPLLESKYLAYSTELRDGLIAQIWERTCDLLSNPSQSEPVGSAFRLWFRWIYQSGGYEPSQDILQQTQYWSLLQVGLLHGYSEPRKLCLGILQKSISILQTNVQNTHMAFMLQDRRHYELQYTKYCTLYEMVVLDRYPNQVSACLGDLSKLMSSTSLIHISWITTLLSAALSSKIQDGIRKMIGLWYIDFTSHSEDGLESQQALLFQGILPWATQGFLFTQSLVSSRDSTECLHGQSLCNLIRRFAESCSSAGKRLEFLRKVLVYIANDVNVFPYAMLYILEGLLGGLRSTKSLVFLEIEDLALVAKMSVRAGLPEVARDLCTTYCMAFIKETEKDVRASVPGVEGLEQRWKKLESTPPSTHDANRTDASLLGNMDQNLDIGIDDHSSRNNATTMQSCTRRLKAINYRSVKGDGLLQALDTLESTLNSIDVQEIPSSLLYETLEVLWDEVDTQEYPKAALMRIPGLALHPTCIQFLISEDAPSREHSPDSLNVLLPRIVESVHKLSESRSYLLPPLAQSLRTACLSYPEVLTILPVDDFLLRFANRPPSPRPDFVFECAAASKLEMYFPHRSYTLYYGAREWVGYACVMDLVNRLPNINAVTAQEVLNQLVKPWATQKTPVPQVSKWKTLTQLQMMLILSEACISKGDSVDISRYLNAFMDILSKEPWPRYRYLLEWILARLYLYSPDDRSLLLDHLGNQGESNPKLTASLMRMAVMVACFPETPESFSLQVATLLVPLCANGKIQIRHEAHWAFPSVWDHVETRGWSNILSNPAFAALNTHIRSLWRFQTPTSPYNSRSLTLDLVKDHNLANLFQGDYLRTYPPERELVTTADFEAVWAADARNDFAVPQPYASPLIVLGSPRPPIESEMAASSATAATLPAPLPSADLPDASFAPLQTKSTTWQHFLTPTGPDPARRHTPLILVASLIANPANLGGLSRIAEIFGADSLALPSLQPLSQPAFTSVAVTSHQHIPIFELWPAGLPKYLKDKKKEGYSIVCVEQTDRSKVLGEEGTVVPRKSVVVLGSEKGGCPAEVLAEADLCVEIKQKGVTRSLNVQTAGAVCLFEYQRIWGNITITITININITPTLADKKQTQTDTRARGGQSGHHHGGPDHGKPTAASDATMEDVPPPADSSASPAKEGENVDPGVYQELEARISKLEAETKELAAEQKELRAAMPTPEELKLMQDRMKILQAEKFEKH